jgi:hypothetical protein
MRAKREEAVQDAWLGPEMKLGGLPAIHNLQMNPGEPRGMVFNGAAQPPPANRLIGMPVANSQWQSFRCLPAVRGTLPGSRARVIRKGGRVMVPLYT